MPGDTSDGDREGRSDIQRGDRGSIVVAGEQNVEMPRRCKDDASPSTTCVRQRLPPPCEVWLIFSVYRIPTCLQTFSCAVFQVLVNNGWAVVEAEQRLDG